MPTYNITGMHCGSCVEKLTRAIEQLPSVDHVTVTLDPPVVTVTGSAINDEEIERAVTAAGDYQVTTDEPSNKSWVQTYYPLLWIVGLLVLVSTIAQLRGDSWQWMHFMSDFMGGFFVVFAYFKILDLQGFAGTYQTYDIVAKRFPAYAKIYPFIELILGVLYLSRIAPLATNIITAAVMLIGAIGVIQSVRNKRRIQCACLGTVFNLPMSTVTIVEDLSMAAMAIAAIIVPPV